MGIVHCKKMQGRSTDDRFFSRNQKLLKKTSKNLINYTSKPIECGTLIFYLFRPSLGEVPEWSNGLAWKASVS
jgi:hypothetical protein